MNETTYTPPDTPRVVKIHLYRHPGTGEEKRFSYGAGGEIRIHDVAGFIIGTTWEDVEKPILKSEDWDLVHLYRRPYKETHEWDTGPDSDGFMVYIRFTDKKNRFQGDVVIRGILYAPIYNKDKGMAHHLAKRFARDHLSHLYQDTGGTA